MNTENEDSCLFTTTRNKPTDEVQAKIAALNDRLRKTGQGGQFMVTDGILALGLDFAGAVLRAVRDFYAFTIDNDPWQEHDCASLEVSGQSIIWKIDYYDCSLIHGSDDPSDPKVTKRVLTVMLAGEY